MMTAACRERTHTSRITAREVGRRFLFRLQDGRELIATVTEVTVGELVKVRVGKNIHDWPEGWEVLIGNADAICVCGTEN